MMTTVFVIALLAIGGLLVAVAFSVDAYRKANELNPYHLHLEELKTKIVVANEKIVQLNDDIERLNADKVAVERVIEKKDEMEAFINNFQEEYDSKKHQMDDLDERLADVTSKVKDAESELTAKNVELTKLQDSINEKNQALHALEQDAKALQLDIDRCNKQLDSINSELIAGRSEKSKLEKDILDLTAKKNDLENQVRELERKREETKGTLANLQNDLNDINVKLAANQKQITAMKADEKLEEARWADLDRPFVEAPVISHNSYLENEEVALATFQKNLKDSGIIFDERTIKAFHTGLKTEDTSPLVVLAGISGTGKTLLPVLYAKAFGMNMLSVAVQPRWDSPQDMFGFYNYMQGRYKATELSRLLWQFDVYNNENARTQFESEDDLPMNLVLLDEMNLARVEYYFSDMLSKLELRRGINPEDDIARNAAEIEIEGGVVGAQKSSRRLFVNGNTLFVGTMNEDETTQSLSDKVMDRSNVLRFGKPGQVSARMDREKFNVKYSESDGYLSYGDWKSCTRESQITNGNQKRLYNVLDGMNNELAKIGRPFAYRVGASVERYISQYPGVSAGNDTSFENALSDQIEMKILPKLNGVDLSAPNVGNVLNSLTAYISEAKDDKLMEAYQSCIDSTQNTFFQWKGVAR